MKICLAWVKLVNLGRLGSIENSVVLLLMNISLEIGILVYFQCSRFFPLVILFAKVLLKPIDNFEKKLIFKILFQTKMQTKPVLLFSKVPTNSARTEKIKVKRDHFTNSSVLIHH